MKILLLIGLGYFYIILFSACSDSDKNNQLYSDFLYIETLAEEHPDSAAILLSQITFHDEDLIPDNNKAFYDYLQVKVDIILGKMTLSNSVIRNVVDFYERTYDKHKLAYAYFYKAKLELSSESDSLAVLYSLKALDMAKITDNFNLSVQIHEYMGNIYLFNNLPYNAFHEFQKAYGFIDKIARGYYYKPLLLRDMARTFNLKGILNSDVMTNYNDSAIFYYNKALMSKTNETPRFIMASVNRELASLYMFKENYKKANDFLNASIDTANLNVYYSRKADIFMQMGELDSASFYISKYIYDPNEYTKISSYSKLLQIEKIRKNVCKVLEYTDSLLHLNNDIISHTIPDKIIALQMKYNDEKLRTEKVFLQLKYEKEKSHSLCVYFIVIILFFLSTYIYIYNYFKKKKLQHSLLRQKNELLLLNQKVIQLNLLSELNQKKIEQLEDEKKKIDVDFYMITSERESLLKTKVEELRQYRAQVDEMLVKKEEYKKLCFEAFKKLFLLTPLSDKLPVFGTKKNVSNKINKHLKRQLFEIMDEVGSNYASRLYTLLNDSEDKTCLCCLIRLQVKPRYIMILCDLNKDTYSKQCQRIAEKLVGKSNMSALKDYLYSF